VRALASYLRGLDPHLARTVWVVQAGGVVNALGNGVVFPFAVIYLHNVRGISFADAGFCARDRQRRPGHRAGGGHIGRPGRRAEHARARHAAFALQP